MDENFGQAETIGTILSILSTGLSIATRAGWFSNIPWCSDVAKAYLKLKQLTGKEYPELKAMGDDTYKAWTVYHNAWPWDKQRTGEEYQKKVKEWAKAIEEETKKYEEQKSVEAKVEVPTLPILFTIGILIFALKEK